MFSMASSLPVGQKVLFTKNTFNFHMFVDFLHGIEWQIHVLFVSIVLEAMFPR